MRLGEMLMNTRRLSYKYHGQSYCALSGQHQVDEGRDNHLYMKLEIMSCGAFLMHLGAIKVHILGLVSQCGMGNLYGTLRKAIARLRRVYNISTTVINSLWPASIGWSTSVYEDRNNQLCCFSYALGCHKGAHSWTGQSMWYGKFPNFKTTKETTFEAAYAKWTK